MSVIYEGTHYRVFAHTPTPGPVIVSFDGWFEKPTLDGEPFGWGFARTVGLNMIGIKSGINDWYQNPEVDEILTVIDRAAGSRERVGYGSSMGGYAALNFSSDLGFSHVLTVAPQFSVDPEKVPWEVRWGPDRELIKYYRRDYALETPPVSGFMIYDNLDHLDELHAKPILAAHHLNALRVPFGGHMPLEFFTTSGMLGQITLRLLKQTMGPREFAAMRRQIRVKSGRYWFVRSEMLGNRGRFSEALTAIQHAIDLGYYAKMLANDQLATMLYATGKRETAREIWAAQLADDATRKPQTYLLRRSARKHGWPELVADLLT